ncbi:hypothetical protein CALCODRAFT_138955 [Calocera cornea HHB12733]|uniref:tRNA (guanine(37)-N1)-methyltransferase n=1 Tax=Calocera cornea HHB12733 TaxID=1353952 RepID=A0A165K368_9BASI|nr:hypothetical protein CALCODRAFT_138955 [Calocera cornea HHB12733]
MLIRLTHSPFRRLARPALASAHSCSRTPQLSLIRNMAIDFNPPPVPLGVLDREKFQKTITVLAAALPVQKIGEVRSNNVARSAVLRETRVQPVVKAYGEKADKRLLLLASEKEEELDQEALAFIKDRALEIVPYQIKLDYDFWDAEDIMRALLPQDIIVPGAFTSVGHVIHLNLRERQLPYKYLIGEVLLDKLKSMRTVVNKTDIIHAQYRYFEMELLAGVPDFLVEVNEHGNIYNFNYREVYYNTRLEREHWRLVEKFNPNEVVCDVMGGVGPFAIPAAKKGCAVLLNDLNPNAIKWARLNVVKNKVDKDLIRLSEIDGIDFIRQSVIDLFHAPFPAWQPVTRLSRRERDAAVRKRLTEKQAKKAASRSPKQGKSDLPVQPRSRSPSPRRQIEQPPNFLFAHPSTSQLLATSDSADADRVSPSKNVPSTPETASTLTPNFVPSGRIASPITRNGSVLSAPSAPSAPSPPASSRSISSQANPESPSPRYVPTGMERRTPGHYILNLPTTALLFLFGFRGFLRPLMATHRMAPHYGPEKNMPMVHVHCFTKEQTDDSMKQDILKRASEVLNYRLRLDMPELELHHVRKVAPMKNQWCLSFRLPWQVAIEDVAEAEIDRLKENLVKAHLELDITPELDEYEDIEPPSLVPKERKREFPNVDMI